MGQSTQERPATPEELITYFAKQHGVAPALALAVAKQESGFDPKAIGDNGKAIGLFQMHEAAAQDTGITDRNDPVQNITGGVKYLKQLSDKYGGDVQKTLMAYNGGSKWVDEGNPSPAAQAYASKVLAELSAQTRQSASRTSQRGPGAPIAQPSGRGAGAGPGPTAAAAAERQAAPSMGGQIASDVSKFVLEPVNPMTVEGRENIAGLAGAGAMMYATGGLSSVPGALAWTARVLGPIVGAATAGAGERAAEEATGTAPKGGVTTAGVRQGLYEAGGQALMWPLRHVGKAYAAYRTRRAVGDVIEDTAQGVTKAVREGVETAQTRAADDVAAIQARGRQGVQAARQGAVTGVRAAKKQSVADLAKAELDNAEAVADIEKRYAALEPPSVVGTAEKVKETLQGPAKRALDQQGQLIEKAAAEGPALTITPLKDLLEETAAKARPEAFFPPPKPGARPIGLVPTVRGATSTERIAAQISGKVERMSAEEYKALTTPQALGLPEGHPLPGILQRVRNAPETITFQEGHQLKRLLDEAVNWDRTAKKHVEGLTKNLRTSLREMLSVHQPYNEATAGYAAMVPLYRRGAGKSLANAALNDPDKIARILTDKNPLQAQSVYDLLVTQAAKGGDEKLGREAWDAVRSAYTYDHVIKGGVDGLADRAQAVIAENPEFAKVLLNDEGSRKIYANLIALGNAAKQAEKVATESIAATKAAGRAGVEAAQTSGRSAITAATERATQGTQGAKLAGESRVAAAKSEGEVLQQQMRDFERKFKKSSVAPYSTQNLDTEATDIALSVMYPGTRYGSLSMLRLLKGPSSADLVQWAAYSDKNTQRLVSALLNRTPDRAASALMRDIGTWLFPPQASHTQEAP